MPDWLMMMLVLASLAFAGGVIGGCFVVRYLAPFILECERVSQACHAHQQSSDDP